MRRERLTVVAALVVLGALVVLASTQSFATVRLTGVKAPLVVAGSEVVPALAPLGIVLLALALALTIAGRFARFALGLLLALLGAAIIAVAMPAVADAESGTRGAVRTATGVTDVGPVIAGVTGTAWPVVAVVAGAAAVLLGVVVLVRVRRWPLAGARYRPAEERAAGAGPVDEWDALSRGTDPTD